MFLFIFQSVIKKKYGQDATNVGDEGGFAPNIQVTFSEQNVILLKLFVANLLSHFLPLCLLYKTWVVFRITRKDLNCSRLPLLKLVTQAKLVSSSLFLNCQFFCSFLIF